MASEGRNEVAEMKFYRSFFDTAQRIPDGDRLAFYDTVMRAYFDGEEVDIDALPLVVQVALPTIFYSLNRSLKAKTGGRPKAEKPSFAETEKEVLQTEKTGFAGTEKEVLQTEKTGFAETEKEVLQTEKTGFAETKNNVQEQVQVKVQVKVQEQVQEQEKEQEREGAKLAFSPPAPPPVPDRDAGKDTDRQKPQRFAPPTVDEVRAHVREKGYSFSPESFWSFYESKGWMVGKSKMKDWRAACLTWQQRERAEVPAPQSQKNYAEEF